MHTDSHTEIIAENNLHEDGARGVNLVKIEISPPGGDMRLPIEQWAYRLDQDSTPEWYDAVDCERRGRAALEKWRAARVIIDSAGVTLDTPGRYWVYSSRVTAMGSSTVVARDSSRVDAWGSSRVEAMDSSRVTAWGSSTVTAMDSSRVEAMDSSRVTAMGSSRVVARGSSRVTAMGSSTVEARGSSRVDAWGSSTVTAMGSSTVVARDSSRVTAMDSSRVTAWGSSTVEACKERATAIGRGGKLPEPTGPMAVVIDRTGEVAVCSVGT
jgi:hypothetical protein